MTDFNPEIPNNTLPDLPPQDRQGQAAPRDPARGPVRHRLPVAPPDLRRKAPGRRRRGGLRRAGLRPRARAAADRGAPQAQGKGRRGEEEQEGGAVRRARTVRPLKVQALRREDREGRLPRGAPA